MSSDLLELADELLAHGGAMLRVDGRNIPLHRSDANPRGLLGVRFGPTVDAVAVQIGPDTATILAVDRSGDAMIVDEPGTSHAPDPDGGSLTLDLARRSLGLPTAPPTRPVAELVDTVWLERILRATLDAPLGDPPRWLTLARLHPGSAGPASSPEVLRHRTAAAPSWAQLRDDVIEARVRWPPVSATLARWFDAGSMQRHVFATLPEPGAVRADLAELLLPADAARVDAALSR